MATAAQQELVKQVNANAGKIAPAVTEEQLPGKANKLPEDNYPEFLSTVGRAIAIALPSGHTISVSHETPTKLHPRFHRRAVELGAMPASIAKQMESLNASDVEEMSAQSRDEIVLKNIGQMVSQGDLNPTLLPTLFTSDGRPDCTALSQRCGFSVRAPERDRLWEVYQGELA